MKSIFCSLGNEALLMKANPKVNAMSKFHFSYTQSFPFYGTQGDSIPIAFSFQSSDREQVDAILQNYFRPNEEKKSKLKVKLSKLTICSRTASSEMMN